MNLSVNVKPKKMSASIYFPVETNSRIVNRILLTVLISVTALNKIKFWHNERCSLICQLLKVKALI